MSRNLADFISRQRDRVWADRHIEDLEGRTVGVVGIGPIGSEVAGLAAEFGMRAIGMRRTPTGNEPCETWTERREPDRKPIASSHRAATSRYRPSVVSERRRRNIGVMVAVACAVGGLTAVIVAMQANGRTPATSVVAHTAPTASTIDRRLITDDTGDIDPVTIPADRMIAVASTDPTSIDQTPTDPKASDSTSNTLDMAVVETLPGAVVGPANCQEAGKLIISAIGTNVPILAETEPFASNLLCGNDARANGGAAAGATEGVDILPGYASLTDSVAGGSALKGQTPAVIFGHRNSHNRPFHDIPKLKAGKQVTVVLTNGSSIHLVVSTVQLVPLAQAIELLLAASPDGTPMVRLVACSRLDGTPGGTFARWIVTLIPR